MTSQTPFSPPRPRLAVSTLKPAYPVEGGRQDLLVALGVDLPEVSVDRPPLALVLVLDRSGSMSGAPLEAAKAAAGAAIEMLLPDDRVGVVAYDDAVRVVAPLSLAGTSRGALLSAVRAIESGGSTALYTGWAEGLSQAMACPVEGASARVVLLSDGLANVGVRDAGTIAADVAQAAAHGVTTTAMGFGRSYDEALLRAMADAGQGNYVFIEGEAQVVEAFQHELSGLSALRGRRVRLEPSSGMSLAAYVPGRLPREGAGVRLPDLVAGLEREIVLTATLRAGAPEPVLTLRWDDLLTGQEEELAVALGVPAVAAEEYERLPIDRTVAAQLALARIAEAKLRLADAARLGDLAGATALLVELQAAVAALPPGDERKAEETELRRLRGLTERREMDLTSRHAEKHARDRMYGASDAKRAMQFAMERDLHAKKLAAAAPPAPVHGQSRAGGAAPRPLARRELRGPAGATRALVMLGDITDQAVDVIVNSTNRNMFGNTGVDGAIHRRGGPDLTLAARGLRGLGYGEAAFTPAFRLPARYVVHAVATPWQGGEHGELDVLAQAYRSALALAAQLGARTLAVPAIGTGSFGVPATAAATVAVEALAQAVAGGAAFEEVRFVILLPGVADAFAAALTSRREGSPHVVN